MTIDADIECIIRQENILKFDKMQESDAWALGSLMRGLAQSRKLPFVIDIRIGARPLYYTALEGTSADNYDWVKRKVRTVQRFEKSSYRVNREHEKRNIVFTAMRGINPMKYALAGGGFPINIKGTGVVGSVTVSGIPQRQDHEFVVECLCQHLGHDYKSLALPPEET